MLDCLSSEGLVEGHVSNPQVLGESAILYPRQRLAIAEILTSKALYGIAELGFPCQYANAGPVESLALYVPCANGYELER